MGLLFFRERNDYPSLKRYALIWTDTPARELAAYTGSCLCKSGYYPPILCQPTRYVTTRLFFRNSAERAAYSYGFYP